MKNPPVPKKKAKELVSHGDKRTDYYYWLRDDKRKNTDILKYLSRENEYTNAWYKANGIDSSEIFKYYKDSLPKYEESFKTNLEGYKYFSTESLSLEYPKYYRIFKNKKKLILDVNKLAKNKKFYEISSINPSRNHKYLAYGEDINGRREFSIVVKDVSKNINVEKNSCSSTGRVIWNKNSNGYFYLKKNPKTLIANTLFFHKLGTDPKKDRLVYKEKDKQFNLSISLSRTKKYLFLEISKTESNEIWFLDLDEENIHIRCFLKRKNNHLYYIDDSPESFFILSNKNSKKNFALYKTSFNKLNLRNWIEVIPHNKNELIEDFLC